MRDRTTIRPTVFGLLAGALLCVAAFLTPAVADPSVVGLVWSGLAGAVLFGVLWPVLTVRNLRMAIRAAPTDLVVGQRASLEVQLSGRASGLSVGCTGEPMRVLDAVAPGVVRIPFTVSRRGAYRRIRVDLGSDAPFAVVTVRRSRLLDLPRELLVGPAPVMSQPRTGHVSGDHAAPVPSGLGHRGEAVRSVRPYLTGDPSHLVHWPSTARAGSLVVRELEPPATEAVAIVVDLSGGDDAAIEHAAARGAGAAVDALRRGARVLLCTAEDDGAIAAALLCLFGSDLGLPGIGPLGPRGTSLAAGLVVAALAAGLAAEALGCA